MAGELESRRIYSDTEISRIIKRAAELQQETGRRDAGGRGISIAELEQMALELGLDPAHIRQAVAELGSGDDSHSKFSLLGRTLIEARRLAKGEMSEREWEKMVQEVRRTFGFTGETGKLGQALEWKTSDRELVRYQVTASPRDEGTDIQIVSRRDSAAFLIYFISVVFGLSSALAVAAPSFSNPVELLAAGGILAGALTTARLLLAGWTRTQKRMINRLIARLESIVLQETPPLATPAAVEQPAVDIRPLLDHEKEDLEPGIKTRTRESA